MCRADPGGRPAVASETLCLSGALGVCQGLCGDRAAAVPLIGPSGSLAPARPHARPRLPSRRHAVPLMAPLRVEFGSQLQGSGRRLHWAFHSNYAESSFEINWFTRPKWPDI